MKVSMCCILCEALIFSCERVILQVRDSIVSPDFIVTQATERNTPGLDVLLKMRRISAVLV